MKFNPTELAIYKAALEKDYLLFVRFFSKLRWGIKFQLNWHHRRIESELMRVVNGETKRLIIMQPPGSSKTELGVVNFIPWCVARNPYSRFLHLSYADSLAELNSSTAKEIIESEEYQAMWPTPVASDSSAKKRWNILYNGKKAGGCYATSVGGQVTGFRAGRMAPGFQGAVILDDPLKPDDAWSQVRRERANRFITNTIKSRLATSETPIIMIMQRLHEDDPVGHILNGPNGKDWRVLKIPAIDEGQSYWPQKEPVEELLKTRDEDRYTFNSQYMQDPTPPGGGMFKDAWFPRWTYSDLDSIKTVRIYSDTAWKKGQHNDFSVFEVWGSDGNRVFLLDLWRGKWESPELKKKAMAVWGKWQNPPLPVPRATGFKIEDKASGTAVIQSFVLETNIPAVGIQREKDKVTRASVAAPYVEAGKVLLPPSAPWLPVFMGEVSAFSHTMAHAHDDQVDPMMDAIDDLLIRVTPVEDDCASPVDCERDEELDMMSTRPGDNEALGLGGF